MTGRMEVIAGILGTLFLLIGSIMDIRRREISLMLAVVFAGIGIAVSFILEEKSWLTVLTAMLPGAVLTVFAALTRGRMGIGDGIAILVMGCFFIFEDLLIMLMLAFGAASVWSAGMLIRGKRRTDSFPFLPFLLSGEILFWILQVLAAPGR
ncbi:MAG: prepilin peptidase [Lachnospiraceae bacterium]|nr:prepilin peptidase [Lachnospiraceae bacterium]